MKLLFTALVLLSALLMTKQGYSSDSCITKYAEYNICAKARELSNEIAKSLPMQMSKNMSWESVGAFESTIIANVRLHYDRALLEATYKQANLPMSFAKDAIIKSANGVCKTKEINSFIGLGGKIKYTYSFIDGEQYLTINIVSCDSH